MSVTMGLSLRCGAIGMSAENIDGIGTVLLDKLASDVLDHLLIVHLTGRTLQGAC